ncbi:MAG: hypothetical protein AB7L76_05550 [Burkholderiaceae bacterium]
MQKTEEDIVALLSKIERHLSLLVDQCMPPRARIGDEDAAILRELYPLMHAEVGDRVFAIADLEDFAAPCRLVRQHGARRIGRLFARTQGCEVDGYVVESVGSSRDGLLWRLRAV